MKRILIDLKPALDGYAGIPQESRLLFSALSSISSLEVDGLIQHGGRRLQHGVFEKPEPIPVNERVNILSRAIVSFYEQPHSPSSTKVFQRLKQRFEFANIAYKSIISECIKMSEIPPDCFRDFLWQALFEKSLGTDDFERLRKSRYRILSPSRHSFHQIGLLAPSDLKPPIYPRIDTSKYDIFLAQTPFPGRVSNSTKLIVRYHDAVPILHPHTVGDKSTHQATHYRSLHANVKDGAIFSCISAATRRDLISIFPEVEARSIVIPNFVASTYFEDAKILKTQNTQIALEGIIKNRRILRNNEKDFSVNFNAKTKYLLMVSTIEPRKNHRIMIRAWEKLIYAGYSDLNLIVVGSLGWDYEAVLSMFKPWVSQGKLAHLVDVPINELKVLYSKAAITICPSLAEGFDYSGVEALMCGSPLISSNIEVHKEVFGNDSEYFDPHSSDQAAQAAVLILSNDRDERRVKHVSEKYRHRYSDDQIIPLWQKLFEQVAEKKL